MKQAKASCKSKSLRKSPQPFNLNVRERELWRIASAVYDLYPVSVLAQNSYVLSRLWAWLSRIELSPHVRIPVPRFLTYRDP